MPHPLYEANRSFSDNFVPVFQRIIGQHLLLVTERLDDTMRATDLIVLTCGPVRIACRVRRHQHLKNWNRANQVTFRSSTRAGSPSELEKIDAGWGDYCIYAFANAAGDDVERWMIGDLGIWRRYSAAYRAHNGNQWPGTFQINVDGLSAFLAVDPATVRLVGDDGTTEHFIVAGVGYARRDGPAISPLPAGQPGPTTRMRTNVAMQSELWPIGLDTP